jgi:hypothetical protein
MRDIELIIKIPAETYEYWKKHKYEYVLAEAIAKGIPLPKGHGRLIDADYKVSSDGRTIDTICGYMAPTIIEADKER